MYVRSHIGVANLSPDRRTTLKQSSLHVLQVRSIHQNFSNSGPTFPVCDRSSMWYRPGSEILSRVTQCLSWAKKRGGSSVRKSIRRWGALSALSSDHGFVGLSSSGVPHATSTICAYAVHIVLNPRCRESRESTCSKISGMPSATEGRVLEVRNRRF